MKIGLFGGTFDPPHIGHKQIIEAVIEQFGIDKLYITPNDSPAYKKPTTDQISRYKMLNLMFPYDHKASPALFELGESYTCDTVRKIIDLNNVDKVFLVMGYDCFLGLGDWKDIDFLNKNCIFIVVKRDGIYTQEFPFLPENFFYLDFEPMDVSSTKTRKLLKSNDSKVKKLLHPDVLEFIETKGLYGKN